MNSPNDAPREPLGLKLPSRFTFSDHVVVFFGSAGSVKDCRIIKVHFTESKVSYDVDVKWKSTPESGIWTDRLYNVDSANVYPLQDFQESDTTQMLVQYTDANLWAMIAKVYREGLKFGFNTNWLTDPYHAAGKAIGAKADEQIWKEYCAVYETRFTELKQQ